MDMTVRKKVQRVKRKVQICLWVVSSTSDKRNFSVLGSLLGLLFLDIVFANFAVSMDRLLGIDFGRKRTGLAASDPLGIFASPLETVHSAKLIDYIKNYAQSERIIRFVVGYPRNLDGRPSEAAADVDVFLKQLAKAFPQIPVTLEDERFTSVLAHRAMIDGGMKASQRRDKTSVDKISAAIILQSYLDRTSRQ